MKNILNNFKKATIFGLAAILAGCSKSPSIEGIVVSEAHQDNASNFQYAWSIVVKDSCKINHSINYAASGPENHNSNYMEQSMREYARLKALDVYINVGDKVKVRLDSDFDGVIYWQNPQKIETVVAQKIKSN